MKRQLQPPRPGTKHLLIRHVSVKSNELARRRADRERYTLSELIRHWIDVYGAGRWIPVPVEPVVRRPPPEPPVDDPKERQALIDAKLRERAALSPAQAAPVRNPLTERRNKQRRQLSS